VKIKKVVQTDFRRNDVSIFSAFQKENLPLLRRLKEDDMIVFVSKTGNQLLFIHGFTEFPGDQNRALGTALQSIRHRILSGTWNPLMLRNYAIAAGLDVEGLALFEDHYKHLVANDNAKRGRGK